MINRPTNIASKFDNNLSNSVLKVSVNHRTALEESDSNKKWVDWAHREAIARGNLLKEPGFQHGWLSQ